MAADNDWVVHSAYCPRVTQNVVVNHENTVSGGA
jgi:hypothetical protein